MAGPRTYIAGFTVILLSACSNDSENNRPYNGGDDATINATVFEQKQSIQCGSSGLSIDQSAQTLITAGIDVLNSECANDNLMAVPSVCGAATSEILVHEISSQNLVDAEAVGFTSTDDIDDDYSIYDCR